MRSLVAGRLAPVAVTASVVALLGLVGCSASSSGNASPGTGGFSGGGLGGSGVNTDGGATDGANPGTGGSTGAAGSGLGGASGTGGATGTGCYVTVTAVAPATTVDVEAGKGARMRVEGHAWGTFTPPITWVWTVSATVGSSMKTVAPTVLDGTGAVVDFPIEDVGRYRVAAVAQSAGRPDCQTPSPLVISTVPAGPMAYDVRVTASGFPVQDMRIALDPSNPQPIAFPMHGGVAANLLPMGLDTGGSLASYIRISDSTSGLSIDADSTHGAVMAPVLGTRAYDVLIVPIDPIDAYAPMYLLNGTPGSWPQPLQLDRGTLVNASMCDSKGHAVVGAHLVLRRGSLPSTVGVGDANGAAVLRARAYGRHQIGRAHV